MAATKGKTKGRKVNYLNKKDLMAAIMESKKMGTMSDTLAKMLTVLCDRYAKKGNYSGYTFNDDMRAYALLSLVKTWDAFDPKKSDNPFAFYTQCVKNSFRQYLKIERKQRDIRDKMLVHSGLNPSHTYMNEYESSGDREPVDFGTISDDSASTDN